MYLILDCKKKETMAEKLNDFANRLSKGTPKGLGLGVKLLVGSSLAVYGIYKSMFTGN
jgi:hypothetical protein